MVRMIALLSTLLLVLLVAAGGCSKTEEPEVDQSAEVQSDPVEEEKDSGEAEEIVTSTNDEPMETSSGVFRNGDGEIVCPVFGIVIESPEIAAGSLELDGVTYYFSESSALEMFKEDPDSYIER